MSGTTRIAARVKKVPILGGVVPILGRTISMFEETVHQGRHLWDRQKYSLNWNYLRNPASRRRLEEQPSILSETQQRIVQDLSTQGIAFTSIEELGVNHEQWERLRQLGADFVKETKILLGHADKSDAAHTSNQVSLQHNLERTQRFLSHIEKARGDDYLIKLYPEGSTFTLDNPLLQIALDAPLLDVVNSYLGLWAKLIYTDVWHSIPLDPGRRVGSQRWHRDPEDQKMIKVYLYLADVDTGAGPLQYIPGSCPGGPYGHLWRWRAAGKGNYPPEGEVENKIPASEWITAVGPIGTLVFCDTDGIHRGGIATTNARIAATWTFVTPASLHSRRFIIDPGSQQTALSEAATFALS